MASKQSTAEHCIDHEEMMPIVNKSLIEFGVQETYDAGMTDICIVTEHGKRAIENHFDIRYELEHQIAGSDKENYFNQNRNLLENCNFPYTSQLKKRPRPCCSGR